MKYLNGQYTDEAWKLRDGYWRRFRMTHACPIFDRYGRRFPH